MFPVGPDRGELASVKVGRRVKTVEFGAGAVSPGRPITIGVKMSNAIGVAYGPVFAPSCARTRQ